jgi:hypothetical protein
MTEQQWLTASDPKEMLSFTRTNATGRKLRLFAAASCRVFWECLNLDAIRTTIQTIELYADDQAGDLELARTRSAAHNAAWRARWYSQNEDGYSDPAERAYYKERVGKASEELLRRLYLVAFMAGTTQRLRTDDMPLHGTDPVLVQTTPVLLREIFGNPFRPVTVSPSWLTPAVARLAEAIYEERHMPSGTFDNHRMGVLADALEEAGCDNRDILDHCRAGGEHVRGCWAVDLVLGRE